MPNPGLGRYMKNTPLNPTQSENNSFFLSVPGGNDAATSQKKYPDLDLSEMKGENEEENSLLLLTNANL